MIVMGVKSVYRFNHNSLSLGVDITHFSNCAFKIPNYGINIPYVSMSYARNLKEDSVSSIRKQIMKYRKLYFGTHGIFSLKEINPHGSRKYPVFAIGAYGRYYFQQKAGAELGIDVISKQSVFDFEPQVDKTQLSIIQLGIYAGYILPLNHLHFFFGMGAYVRDRYQPNGPLYHRIGFRYQMSNGMYGNITLKTHWAKADYMEVGLGYIVNYKNKGVFVLALTSNPGSNDFQKKFINNKELYKYVIEMCNKLNRHNNVGLVIGATNDEELDEVALVSNSLPWLMPGIGFQGGNLKRSLLVGEKNYLSLVNVSRGILSFKNRKISDIREATLNYTNEIREIL